MNPQQVIKILLNPKIKPNEKRRNICLRKQIRVEFCQTILGINPEGAIFESFQITNSKKKVGTSTWRTVK